MALRLVRYRDAPIALVTADQARLVPRLESLDEFDPSGAGRDKRG